MYQYPKADLSSTYSPNHNLIVNPHSAPQAISSLNQLEPLFSALDAKVEAILLRVKVLNAQFAPNKPIYSSAERDIQLQLIQELEILALQFEQQLNQVRPIYFSDRQASTVKKISTAVSSYLSSGLSKGFVWMKAATALPATLWHRQHNSNTASNMASALYSIETGNDSVQSYSHSPQQLGEPVDASADNQEQAQFLKYEKDLFALFDFIKIFRNHLQNTPVQSNHPEALNTSYTTPSYQPNPRPYDMTPPAIYIDPKSILTPQRAYTPAMANASASVTSQTAQAAQSVQPANLDHNYGNYV